MKKLIFGLLVLLAFVVSIAVSASSQENETIRSCEKTPDFAHVQGKHCTGTVGCSCTGFAPIKNKEVWQEAYCKHCGHHKRYHK